MGSKNKPDAIRLQTPEYEHPLIFRDLIVAELRGYHDLQIDNVEGREGFIDIRGAKQKDIKRIVTRIRDLGICVFEM